MNKLIEIVVGDITQQETDIIVNSANLTLLPGGGVDGAIHRAAGLELRKVTCTMGGCDVGRVKHTSGFQLKAKYIIHTVAPRYHLVEYSVSKHDLLVSCYVESLNLAKRLGARSISFPALGTGVYGWKHEESAKVIFKAILEWVNKEGNIIDIKIVLNDIDTANVYRNHKNIA